MFTTITMTQQKIHELCCEYTVKSQEKATKTLGSPCKDRQRLCIRLAKRKCQDRSGSDRTVIHLAKGLFLFFAWEISSERTRKVGREGSNEKSVDRPQDSWSSNGNEELKCWHWWWWWIHIYWAGWVAHQIYHWRDRLHGEPPCCSFRECMQSKS